MQQGLEYFGFSTQVLTVLNPIESFYGLILLILIEFFLFYIFFKGLTHLSKGEDKLSIGALAVVLQHSVFIFFFNAIVQFQGFAWSGPLALIGTLMAAGALFLCKAKVTSQKEGVSGIPKLTVILLIFVFLWSAWILLLGCGIDFGKFHFGLASTMVNQNCLPGAESFPFLKNMGYHYGPALFMACLKTNLGLTYWIGEDILPFFASPVLFLGFRWLGLNILKNERQATLVAFLAFFGTNIRIFFILFMTGAYFFSGKVTYHPEEYETLRMFTRDFSLSPSTVITHLEQLILPASQLGLPILILFLGLWTQPKELLYMRVKLFLTFLLLSSLSLFREDYLVFCFLFMFGIVCVHGLWKNRLFWTLGLFLLFTTIFMGGTFTGATKGMFESFHGKEIKKENPKIQLALNNNNIYKESQWTFRPRLASLSIDVGRRKVSLWHPQIIWDLILDYGPSLLGLFFLPLFFIRLPKKLSIPLLMAFSPYMVAYLWIDHPLISYKLDIQRILNYNLLCWLFLTSFVYVKGFRFSNLMVALLTISGILAGLFVPATFRVESWGWVDRELMQIGKEIQSDAGGHKDRIVLGLNPGYTGMNSYAYRNENNLHHGEQKILEWKELYEKGNFKKIWDRGGYYLVLSNQNPPDLTREKILTRTKNWICLAAKP